MSMYGIIVLALVLAFLTFLGTALYRSIAIRINIIDYPNDRSSHSVPTPSGAGLVFVGLTIGCIYLVISPTNGDWAKLSLLLSFSAIALLGTLDDGFDLPVGFRLLLQILFVVGAMTAVNDMVDLHAFWSYSLIVQVIVFAFVLLGMLWFLNLYNFMDGIDGLAASEAVFIAGSSGIFLYLSGDIELSFWMMILVATLAGFLYWNWAPAKVFMGDAGSAFLGFFFASVALLSIARGDLSLCFWLILCGLFIVDATVTILYRAIRGENILRAHRTHAYQHASATLNGHAPVVRWAMLINVLWLFPGAALSYFFEPFAVVVLVITYLPLIGLCMYLGAGRAQQVASDPI